MFLFGDGQASGMGLVSIMSQVDAGKLGVAAAYSTVLIIIVLVVTGILKLLLNRMGVNISDVQG